MTGAAKGAAGDAAERPGQGRRPREGGPLRQPHLPQPEAEGRLPRRQRRAQRTKRFAVLKAGDNPKPRFYRRKTLRPGLNYVKVRDGIELAMTVRLPSGKTAARRAVPDADRVLGLPGRRAARPALDHRQPGARPARARELDRRRLADRARCWASPSSPSRCAAAAARAAPSGSSTSRRPTTATTRSRPSPRRTGSRAARSGWPASRFSGITQLFTAGTRPPHLAAIAPMSVTDDLYLGTGNPGGIPNVGFARTWIEERMDDARPAPQGGQPYARALVERGDRHCRRNQRLRLQTQDAVALQERDPAARAQALRRPLARRAGWAGSASRPSSSARSRTSRPAATSRRSLGQAPQATRARGSRSRTASTPTRSARARSPAGWSSSSSTSPTRSRRVPESVLGLSGPLYRFLADAPAAPVAAVALRRRHRRRRRPRHVRAGPARPAADGERRRPGRPGLDRRVVGARLRRVADPPRPSRPTSSSARAARSRPRRPPRAPPSTSPIPARARPRRCPAKATRTPGRRSRPTTGGRSRTARASASPRAPLHAGRRHRRRARASTCASRPRRATPTSRSR